MDADIIERLPDPFCPRWLVALITIVVMMLLRAVMPAFLIADWMDLKAAGSATLAYSDIRAFSVKVDGTVGKWGASQYQN